VLEANGGIKKGDLMEHLDKELNRTENEQSLNFKKKRDGEKLKEALQK
jgi:hypothetical protein